MSQKVYQIITRRILDELDRGVVPWQQPWTPDLAPQNFVSRKPYRGINLLLLSIAAQRFGCPFFATRRQITNLGGDILEAERRNASLAVLWKWMRNEDPETGEVDVYPICRYYRVWNLAQTDLEWSLPERHQNDPIEECEKLIRNYQDQDGPSIHREESSFAYYSLVDDSVHVPTQDRFIDSYSFYQVLFHELSHSTGQESRLDRNLTADRDTRDYAREELCAEIASAYLLGSAGLIGEIPVTNSIAYIQNWQQALKDDPRCVVCAASRAQRAADWVLGFRDQPNNHDRIVEQEACQDVA
jgi:antirestriction protein ArdC